MAPPINQRTPDGTEKFTSCRSGINTLGEEKYPTATQTSRLHALSFASLSSVMLDNISRAIFPDIE